MKTTTRARLFGGTVLLFNFFVVGRYRVEGIALLILTIGFAVGFELFIVRLFAKQGDASSLRAPKASGKATSMPQKKDDQETPWVREVHTPMPRTMSRDDEAKRLGVVKNGVRYQYKTYSYDRFDDALAYARLDHSRVVKCK